MVSPGGNRERETPVPIPNTAVKPLFADGTARVTVWESRALPGLEIIYVKKGLPQKGSPFSLTCIQIFIPTLQLSLIHISEPTRPY